MHFENIVLERTVEPIAFVIQYPYYYDNGSTDAVSLLAYACVSGLSHVVQ